MNDDARSLLRAFGCLPTVLGAIVIGLGAFYLAMEWRYGGAVFFWSLMWGLMLSGVGLAVMSTGRRWMAAFGIAACCVSALLVYLWEREVELEAGWSASIYSGDAIGGVIGLAAIVHHSVRRWSANAATDTLPQPRMKVAAYERYGPPDVVQLKDVAKPSPKDNEVLIRVRATTVNSGDWRVRSLEVPSGFKLLSRLFLGYSKPRQPVLGTELSGTIEAVGAGVTMFKAGDEVFAFSGVGMGCHVEYKCMREDGRVLRKPANLSFDEAAALSFGGTTALSFLRRGKLQSGETVLVNGASGAVGVALVQLASKHFGAEVTGVCSGANEELVRSLGASRVIDYTKEDFTKNGETYDVIVDTVGTAPFSRCQGSLKERGRLLLVLAGLGETLQAPWVSLWGDKKVIAGPAAEDVNDLRLLADLALADKFRPIIDRRYPFDQIVEAHRYVDTGRKRGSVVVTLGE